MVARPCIASLKPRGHMIRQKPETSIPTLSLLLNNRKTMHKQTSFLLAAIATAAHAAEQPSPAPPPAAPAGQQQPLPTYEEYNQNMLAGIDALNGILSAVKDKASADQAAEQAFAIYDELNKLPLPEIIKKIPTEQRHRAEIRQASRKGMSLRQLQKHISSITTHEGYTSERMNEFIAQLQKDRWIDFTPAESPNAQTDPAKLQILERELSAFLDKILAEMENLNNLLQTVQDTASADAAAEKLVTFEQEIKDNGARIIEKNGWPPLDMNDRITQPRLQRMEAIHATSETIRKKLVQQNYYGSKTLKKAIRKFPKKL